jgi:hypothetical protein
MNTSVSEQDLAVRNVVVTEDTLSVDLTDGRTLLLPLGWYPRLLHGTPEEREHWELIAQGSGIHWPDLDEDLSLEGLLAGRASAESQRSFERWLRSRTAAAKRPTSGSSQ